MGETDDRLKRSDTDFCSWIGFWVPFGALGVLAVLGAFFASKGGAPGDYGCGMTLSLGSIALAFLRLKSQLDGGAPGWAAFMLVDDMQNLALVIPLFTLIGLAGLFIADAWDAGALHDAGIGLFLVSGLVIFLTLKRVFDRLDRNR